MSAKMNYASSCPSAAHQLKDMERTWKLWRRGLHCALNWKAPASASLLLACTIIPV